ncbi:MAG: hypothetical protein HXS54_05470 [Theionarchaea archaeon]|nr:hypothetical protein [Theionarchaea archaeon]
MIEDYSFGRIIINGKVYTEDIIIHGNTILNWWRIQGHSLSPEDITAIVEELPETLVVGTGAYGRMKIPEKTVKFIEDLNISLIAEKTGKAVDIFNTIEEKKAAALHLTC